MAKVKSDQQKQAECNKVNKTYKPSYRILLSLISIFQSQQKPNSMKITSPFLPLIQDCKKKMRRLRKKIYKYLTSKQHKRQALKSKENLPVLKSTELPLFLQQMLSKKKKINLNFIRNINVSTRIPLSQMVNFVSKQEANIEVQYSRWELEELQKQKRKQQTKKESAFARQIVSKNTISSTEQFEFNQEMSNDQSQFEDVCESFYHQFNLPPQQKEQFNPFMVQSGFLQIESSMFSNQNLFK